MILWNRRGGDQKGRGGVDDVSRENPPGTDYEAVVAEIWCEVLEVPQVGHDDNFFDLGGHSILLQMVRERVALRIGKNVELIDFFTYPTVRSLARHIGGDGETGTGRGRRRPAARANRLGNRRDRLGGRTTETPGEFA